MAQDWCAEITLPAIEETRALGYWSKVVCLEATQGPNPAGTPCYFFLSVDKNATECIRSNCSQPLPWDSDSLAFYTLSEQRDGNLWWSWSYGVVVKAAGMLSRD
jgi:hypothetical protein